MSGISRQFRVALNALLPYRRCNAISDDSGNSYDHRSPIDHLISRSRMEWKGKYWIRKSPMVTTFAKSDIRPSEGRVKSFPEFLGSGPGTHHSHSHLPASHSLSTLSSHPNHLPSLPPFLSRSLNLHSLVLSPFVSFSIHHLIRRFRVTFDSSPNCRVKSRVFGTEPHPPRLDLSTNPPLPLLFYPSIKGPLSSPVERSKLISLQN